MPVDSGRSRIMKAIRSKNTKPELLVRRWLHRHGFRFRIHSRQLPGKPDVVLPRYKTAIQVRGCFWHKHTCSSGKIPLANREYWEPKLYRNRQRDAETDLALANLGFHVCVVWECETRDAQQFENRMRDIVGEFCKTGTKEL